MSERLTDEEILSIVCKETDGLDATRVHEARGGRWQPTTIMEDSALLRFARSVEAAALERAEREREELRKALQYCVSGMALAYAAAEAGRNDEALLHLGCHEAKARTAIRGRDDSQERGGLL